ncbi:hypothetical protein H0H87_011700 [Tephrocybe sp. NHM501043]|nr:hypothetical protein H0H87_011700 [Tephrocybe sp. NHM501043]
MSLPSLPVELLRSILSHIPPSSTSTLLALLQTSPVLNDEASRHLYHTFNTHRHDPISDRWTEIPAESQLGFFRRVAKDQRVAGYVQRVNFEHFDCRDDEFWDTVGRAFGNMKNLEILAYVSWEMREFSRTLARCLPSLLRLKILEWNCSGCDDDLMVFLPTLQRLERLIIYGWNHPIPVPTLALRELIVFHFNISAAIALVSSGTVKKLRLDMSGEAPVNQDGDALPEEFLRGIRGVEELRIGPGPQAPIWLSAIADYLDNVSSLDVSGTQPTEFSKLLKRIPQLQNLTLSEMNRPVLTKSNAYRCIAKPTERLVKEIFRRNRGLRTIDVRNDTARCVRWLRDAEAPIQAPRKYFWSYLPWNNGSGEEEWVD